MLRMQTIHGAAQTLKKENPEIALGENALRAMAKTGKIPCVKVGVRKILINIDALEQFLSSAEVPAQQERGIRQIRA